MGRTSDAKEKLLDVAFQLIWDNSYGGVSVDQICERAKDSGVDLIVTSTHGTTGLKHVLLGSTAEYVVRHAQSPVLVVPSHERPTVNPIKTQT